MRQLFLDVSPNRNDSMSSMVHTQSEWNQIFCKHWKNMSKLEDVIRLINQIKKQVGPPPQPVKPGKFPVPEFCIYAIDEFVDHLINSTASYNQTIELSIDDVGELIPSLFDSETS